MSPLPTTRIVHPRWATHHGRAVEGFLRASCRVRRPGVGEGTFNPSTGNVEPPTPTLVYEGACDAQVIMGGSQSIEVGDDKLAVRQYRVVLPRSAPPVVPGEGKDWVEFTDSPDDPQLVSEVRRMSILSVQFGTWTNWQRDLICQVER